MITLHGSAVRESAHGPALPSPARTESERIRPCPARCRIAITGIAAGSARFSVAAAGIAACMSLMGCSGGDFASELPAKPQAAAVADAGGRTVHVPRDERFSIALPAAQKSPGLGGKAEADANATADGSADATAGITDGGTASASFQLGHAFKNDSSRQMDLDVVLRFAYEFRLDASPPGKAVNATVGLKLYARNSRNILVRRDDLYAHAAERGAASRSGTDEVRVTITLGPGDSISVFLAGQAAIEAEFGRSAHCAIKISGMQMDVTSRPAAAVRTTTSGPG